MSLTGVFLLDLVLTVIVSLGMLSYLSKHLRVLLVELCGTTERARFWLAFSNIALILVPLILALDYRPEFGANKVIIFEIAAQLKCALTGFAVTLGFLALVLISFVRRTVPRIPGDPAR
jgi:hypothetical protein